MELVDVMRIVLDEYIILKQAIVLVHVQHILLVFHLSLEVVTPILLLLLLHFSLGCSLISIILEVILDHRVPDINVLAVCWLGHHEVFGAP